MLLPSLVQPGAIGIGDVKLGALLGTLLASAILSALLLGFLAFVPAGLSSSSGRALACKATLPAGRLLALAAAIVLLA
jgi:hypothetical protein